MNNENFRDLVVDAISYFDGESHERKDSIKTIDFTDDSIIVITKDNKSYLLNIIELDDVLESIKNIKKLEIEIEKWGKEEEEEEI